MPVPEIIKRVNNGIRKFLAFFPVHLFLLHIRRSYILMLFWVFLFGIVTHSFATTYGFPYLFLTPEYLDKVGFSAYFIIGVTCGLFIMSFHISSYVYYSYRFPFLATFSRPLYKFCINNSVIPLAFIIIYIYQIVVLQLSEEVPVLTILFDVFGFLSGTFIAITLVLTYFFTTNKNVLELFGNTVKEQMEKPLDLIIKEGKKAKEIDKDAGYKIKTYLKNFASVRLVRGARHYRKKWLLDVLQQHHRNASVFFIVILAVMILLSIFREHRLFMLPAGASIFILFTVYLMLTAAIYSRFKSWSISVLILLTIAVNYLSGIDIFNKTNAAYGLNYAGKKASYNYETFSRITTDSIIQRDKKHMIAVLDRWKEKTTKNEKPKIVFINTTGGGLRSSLWTFYVLQQSDSSTHGRLMHQAHLITGSSGGMIGAAYLRELYREQQSGQRKGYYHDSLSANMGRDILNPVAFSLAVNDLFLNLQSFKDGKYSYIKDRGYAFENKLNENTTNSLDHRVRDYYKDEAAAQIPIMLISPTLVNDGRRLLISSQPISYLSVTRPLENGKNSYNYDGVEFSRFFKEQDAGNLKFTSALRMSASFPYITPLVNLPSKPMMEIIDAGVRDNDGFALSLRFLYYFKDWVNRYTSGIVFVQVRGDTYKDIPINEIPPRTALDALARPVGGVVKSFKNQQAFNNAQLLEMTGEWLEQPIDIVTFQLIHEKKDVSLSWHLTQKEKERIMGVFHNAENQAALERLKHLLNVEDDLVSGSVTP